MSKINIAVIFGGKSSEHEVSCMSAQTVIKHLDPNKYNIYPVGITREGQWLLYNGLLDEINPKSWKDKSVPAIISPDGVQKSLLIFKEEMINIPLDVVFPVLHGLYGEDGTVQGLLELSGIPYVGCGVLASAMSMDKLYTKIVVDDLNIRQAKYLGVFRNELSSMSKVVEKIEAKFDYPVFIKPSNAGSSVGVNKASNTVELIEALKVASQEDRKILVEEFIDGREVECAVLGTPDDVDASGVGEIIAAAEFYDYDAKYNNAASETILNADLPKNVVENIRKAAQDIFIAVDGFGLARVDFFVESNTNDIVFNEINTLPGFTSISMYPMLWEEKGISKNELVDQLINLAMEREK